MANSKKRRKLIIFAVIGVVIVALTLAAVFKKRDVLITVSTEKVTRHNMTELVVANGKIQPVLQVKISPEVSGEITELPFKEGQDVKKGDLIVKIKPDFYIAAKNQAEAAFQSALSGKAMAEASLEKAESEFKKNERLFKTRLISDTVFVEARTAYDIAKAQLTNSTHQIEMSRAQLARAEEDLAKTTIVSPINGTISRLNSQVGERVVGTATMAGTEVMTIADLDEMEARVDIGEIDVVLIKPGQKARLEVDAFKDRKFTGTVTEIANTAKGFGQMNMGGQSQEATKFEVKIRIQEKENFRPGMSVSTEIETRYRTNVLTVPLAAVTTRMPKDIGKTNSPSKTSGTASIASTANAADSPPATNALAATNATTATGTNSPSADKKSKDAPKPVEVVFVLDGDKVKQVPVKIGISDENYWEITQGLKEEQEIVSGGYKAVNRELEDGKKIRKGMPDKSDDKDKEKK
jgi:HlyD family secretion protein